jgi:hypothetical protein
LSNFAILSLAGVVALFGQTPTLGWHLQSTEGDHSLVLTYAAESGLSYRFDCGADGIIVTQTGVTELMDLKTGEKIGDGPDAVMTDGAALMAVFGGKGDPAFKPAEAKRNPAGGWDLTIRLPKNDKQLKTVGRSNLLSLFTTGITMDVEIDAPTRATWNDFLRRCQAAG